MLLGVLLGLAGQAGAAEGQQRPLTASTPPATLAVSAEWLHATSGSLHRDALPSYAWGIAVDRPSGLRLEAGYLRAARPATTAKGVTGGAGFNLRFGPLTMRPTVAALLGVAERSADRDGYDWRGLDGTPESGAEGHEGRPGYERGTTVGAGLGLAADFRLINGVSLTGSVRQWTFAGPVLRGDRDRTLAGLGLSFHPITLVNALRGRPAMQVSGTDQETEK
jgi:hypothetical protein